jgi:hypothetical protein
VKDAAATVAHVNGVVRTVRRGLVKDRECIELGSSSE